MNSFDEQIMQTFFQAEAATRNIPDYQFKKAFAAWIRAVIFRFDPGEFAYPTEQLKAENMAKQIQIDELREEIRLLAMAVKLASEKLEASKPPEINTHNVQLKTREEGTSAGLTEKEIARRLRSIVGGDYGEE